jgi:hypothetical protein
MYKSLLKTICPLTVMAKSEQGKYNKGLVILPMLAVVFWSQQE